MNLNPTIQNLSGDQLQFEIARPSGYAGIILPGFTTKLATGSFGNYFIQEYNDADYLFQYCIVDTRQRFIARTIAKGKGLFANISMGQTLTHQVRAAGEWKVREGEFTKIPLLATGFTSQYEAGMRYTFINTFFSAGLVKEVIRLFPEMDLQNIKAEGKRISESIRQYFDSILHCRYKGELRRHFFNSRVKDLLVEYMVQWSQVEPERGQLTQREIDAVHTAEKIITEDISNHFTIPELARMVHLSEYRFKIVFKKIFETGAYEYLQIKRMKKARQLLEQGYLVKEVAAETGYHLSYFINIFRETFGVTPGSIGRRKN